MHAIPAPPVISALTAGVLIIVQMLLVLLVVMQRRKNKTSLGDGNPDVLRAARRHGNFAENAAIFVVAAALLEMLGAERQGMEILCGIFVAGRLSHAIGLSMKETVNPFRVLGIVATVGVGVVLGVRLVMVAWPMLT